MKSLHVLMVEDEASEADLIVGEIHRCGFESVAERVCDASTLADALARESWDIVIANQSLPHLSAVEALRIVKTNHPELPFVIVSGTNSFDSALEAMRLGASDYVAKGDHQRLGPAVERSLREAQLVRQHHQVEQKLRESEARFRQLAEQISEVFWMTNAGKTQMLYVSPGYELIWGRTCASLYRSPGDWMDAILPEDQERVREAAFVKQVSGEYEEQYRIARPDGTVRWILDRAFPVKDQTGQVYRIVGVARDITEIKKAEEVLRLSEERFRTLFESAPIPMAIHGGQGRFAQTNRAYQAMLGYSDAELLRIGIKGVTFPADIPEGQQFYKEMLEGRRGTSKREKRFVRKDGAIVWGQSTSSVVRNSNGELSYIVSMVEDITERKQLAEEILRVSEREQQRFGQDVHDGLCQNLVALKFKTVLLERKLSDASSGEIAQAKGIVQLLNQAIQEAYNLARGLQPVKIEADGLLCALEELASKTQSGSDVRCTFRSRNNVLIADNNLGIHLYRIAQEAVSNALKHAQATRLWISLIASHNRIILTIKDNGLGFPSPPPKGGMGLSIMRYRAGVTGASFDIRRRAHRGSRVTCVLRLQDHTGPIAAILSELSEKNG